MTVYVRRTILKPSGMESLVSEMNAPQGWRPPKGNRVFIFRQYGVPSGYQPNQQPGPATWRYRRITHDSGFNSTPSRQAAWEKHYPIGCCISATEFVTLDEIAASVRAYCAIQRIKIVPVESDIRAALTDLEAEKLIESKYGDATP